MERLLKTLSAIEPLSEEFKTALAKKTETVPLPKSHYLLQVSKVSDTAFFMETGFAMSFRYVKGKKHIDNFFKEESIVVSPRSFFQQLPSKESIITLTPSNILHISYRDVMLLLDNFKEASSIYRVIMNNYYEESRERVHDFQLLDAFERYEKFKKTYPLAERLVPHEQIATYLGIAPQHLSRLKRESKG